MLDLLPWTEAARAMAGQRVEVFLRPGCGIPCCTLRMEGGRFRMNGISGNHSLDVAGTDAARLSAHWSVFRSVNLGRAAAAVAW